MAKFYSAILCLVLASVLISGTATYGATNSGLKDKLKPIIGEEGIDRINTIVGGNWSSIDEFSLSLYANSTNLKDFKISQYGNLSWVPIIDDGVLVEGNVTEPPTCPADTTWNGTSCVPDEPPAVEICNNQLDDDGDGLVDEGCPVIPPPEAPDTPSKDVNKSEILRVATFADIDDGDGLNKMLSVMNEYGVDILIINGDYAYSSASGVIKRLNDAGYDKENTALILGNHDSKSVTNTFNGRTVPYGSWNLDPDGKVFIVGIDANSGFGCTGTQFDEIKDETESSDGWYNIISIHQPFVMSESGGHHSPNGKFSCYDPLFRGNGVDVVLQGHEHNYQRYDINGLEYIVAGAGNRDGPDGEDGSLYPLGSKEFKGFDCLKCFNNINGFVMMDFKIDDPHERNVNGWFLSSDGAVKDKFNLRD